MPITPCFDPTTGASGGAAPGGGGGGMTQELRFADGTVIGSGVSAGAPDGIRFDISDGQAAAVTSAGLGGMIGGIYWQITSPESDGPGCFFLEWTTAIPENWFIVLVLMRADSAPTTLSDFQSSSKWLVMRTSGTTGVSTALGQTTAALPGTVSENKASSVSVQCAICVDTKGLGPSCARHYYTATGTQARTQSNTVSKSTGDFYVGLLYAKAAITATSDTSWTMMLRGGLPQ